MSNWIKFTHNNLEAFGIISGSEVDVYDGDMFDNPSKTDEKFDLKDVIIKNPCQPSKMIALWNNYQSLANEKGLSKPKNPLYLNKAISCIIEQGESIIRPKNYDESIFYEGELGIVIGKTCKEVSVSEASDYIFGYTCINDAVSYTHLTLPTNREV